METRDLKTRAVRFSRVLMILFSVPLVLGLLKDWHPAFDSLSHFRAHLAVLLGLTALPVLVGAAWKEGATALALAIASLLTVTGLPGLPGSTPVRAAADPDTRAMYRLLQLNLRFDNRTPERVLSLIGRTKPDAITLEEVSTKWIPILDRLSSAYPYRVICPSDELIGGVAILSRRSFQGVGATYCYGEGSLAVAAVNFGGSRVEVAAMHLSWPWPFRQPRQINDLAPALGALADTALLAGDLNATGWSAAVAHVAEAGDLTPIRAIGPTWLHRSLPPALRRWVGLPIDQVLAKGNVVVRSVTVQEEAGSDHLPVLVEFSLFAGAPPADEERQAVTTAPTQTHRPTS